MSLCDFVAEETEAERRWYEVHPYDIEPSTRLRSKRHASLIYLVDSVTGNMLTDLVRFHKERHPAERRQLTRAECYKHLEPCEREERLGE